MNPGKPSADELLARAAKISLIVLDVDGVLTDGGLYYGPDGEVMKRFDVKDGHAIVMARLVGLPTAILTARKSQIVETRARELGCVAVLQGQKDKIAGFRALCAQLSVDPATCAYMGDDVNDLGVMDAGRSIGLPQRCRTGSAGYRDFRRLQFGWAWGSSRINRIVPQGQRKVGKGAIPRSW